METHIRPDLGNADDPDHDEDQPDFGSKRRRPEGPDDAAELYLTDS